MRKLCVFLGLAAICYRLNVGSMLSLFVGSTAAESINVVAAAAISAWFVARCRLAERVASAQWMVAGFGAAGALVFLGKYFSGAFSLWLLLKLGIVGSSVVTSIFDAVLLLCFLKLTADLTPATDIVPLTDPGMERLIRIFLGLMLFLGTTFSLVPSGLAITEAISKRSLEPFTWLGWLNWGIEAAIAAGFIVYAKVGARLPDSPPGLKLMTFAVVVNLLFVAVMSLASSGRQPGEMLLMLLAVAVFASPIVIGANVLLAIGLLKVLFNLGPSREAAVDVALTEWPAEPLDAPQLPKPSAPAKPSAQDLAQAVVRARANLAAKPGDSMLHQQFHQRLLADPAQQPGMLEHARKYLAVLVKESKGALALKVLQTCLDRDPDFKPSPEQVVPLAKLALSSGECEVALRVMNQFDRLNPGHASTPSVYFLSAKALRDVKQLEKARQVLDAMLARFPDDPLALDAKALRKGLERA